MGDTRYHKDSEHRAKVIARRKRDYAATRADPAAHKEYLRKCREQERARRADPDYCARRRDADAKRRAEIKSDPERLAKAITRREAYRARVLASDTGYKRMLLAKARERAVSRGLQFDINLHNVIWPTHCPIFGVQLTYSRTPGAGMRDFGPSLDRVDPSKGYTPANTQVISIKANRMKNDATLDEMIALGEWARRLKAQIG